MHEIVEAGASDLHIKAGCRPRMRLSGELISFGDDIISREMAHSMALDLMSTEQANRFELEGDLELTYHLKEAGRFRINVFRQQGDTCMAIRNIPDKVPTIEELRLSPMAERFAEKPHGLVLVTGPTCSGKTTSLAAMINHINLTRACNIITMEDPIEFVHEDKKAQIIQREIGKDVVDYAAALRCGLRQDPDVIMVGELRDLETISLALTAAETGHLGFATLHTTSAAQTPSRIIDVFPPGQQDQIRVQLADSLQGIISQILLPKMEGGLVLAQEVLVATEGVRALIRDNRTAQIDNMLQTGAKEGMLTLDASLTDLVKQGFIQRKTALSKAKNPSKLQSRDDN
ncbi:MAG: PilT/PilU family type 4a pilus ATPase [Planctomycetes bacterium]|nr:PilT/PilU family type 4a pilus ATPase [Planctomycetota bacterium]